jgi:hypothetical protein
MSHVGRNQNRTDYSDTEISARAATRSARANVPTPTSWRAACCASQSCNSPGKRIVSSDGCSPLTSGGRPRRRRSTIVARRSSMGRRSGPNRSRSLSSFTIRRHLSTRAALSTRWRTRQTGAASRCGFGQKTSAHGASWRFWRRPRPRFELRRFHLRRQIARRYPELHQWSVVRRRPGRPGFELCAFCHETTPPRNSANSSAARLRASPDLTPQGSDPPSPLWCRGVGKSWNVSARHSAVPRSLVNCDQRFWRPPDFYRRIDQ